MDLLDQHHVSWIDFFSDLPTAASSAYRTFPSRRLFGHDDGTGIPSSSRMMPPKPTPCALACGVVRRSGLRLLDPVAENDEHPPTDIRKGQSFVSMIVNALERARAGTTRSSSSRTTSMAVFYDHGRSSRANQGGARNPDGIDPGQCADASNKPARTQPGGGANCNFSAHDAAAICPGFTPPDLTGVLRQLRSARVRVPFVAVSPFSRPPTSRTRWRPYLAAGVHREAVR